MFVSLVTLLVSTALSAEIDPKLTEWILIKKNVEVVDFPLKDVILQIKSFRHLNHNDDPLYSNSTVVDKSTSMLIHYMSKGERLGQFVWNTIPYVAGTDVIIFGCQAPYSRYRSNPCGGKVEQIWSWNFEDNGAALTCDEELQYEVDFRSQNYMCQRLASADIDQIRFTNMKGFYYRGEPKPQGQDEDPGQLVVDLEIDPTTQPPPTTYTASSSPGFAEWRTIMKHPTCNCRSRQCNSCRDTSCATKYSLSTQERGVTVSSLLNRRKYNVIHLYNSEGKRIGYFKWNMKAIFLEGCIMCRTPRFPFDKGQINEWNFSMVEGNVRLIHGGEVRYEHQLVKRCADYYKDVAYFAFSEINECESTFDVKVDMMLGEKLNETCNGKCEE